MRNLALGVSPYFGIKVPVGERFLINFQTGCEYNYRFVSLKPVGMNEAYESFKGIITWPLNGELGVYWRF